MNNNDILIRLRYALDIKNKDMIKIFKLGGLDLTEPELLEILTRQEEDTPADEKLSSHDLEVFLNGFIISQRGEKRDKDGNVEAPSYMIKNYASINNVALKKIKIAMSYTTDDILSFLDSAGFRATKGELGAVLRQEGHRNYKICGDQIFRYFLKGMALEYRSDENK
ncbi:MAG: DUF1456 family protein [Lactobacillales bacterium]|jgi:uncharacterized protein YehS (DUF1456 family)|nr:DUF1456 family protein [Lactobacillales bacterium]